MPNHPNLPSGGFPTSTIYTLGTDRGVILIRTHTEGEELFMFAAFVEREQFDVNFHWTSWHPREGATDITHEALIVPLEGQHVLSTSIQHQPAQFHYSEQPQPPQGHAAIPQEENDVAGSTEGIFPADEQGQETESHVTDSGYGSAGSFHEPAVQIAQTQPGTAQGGAQESNTGIQEDAPTMEALD